MSVPLTAAPYRWTSGSGPAPGLTRRFAVAMAYDEVRGLTVLFGGREDSGEVSDETWIHDGSRWITGPPAPAALGCRYAPAMAYDGARGVIVLF